VDVRVEVDLGHCQQALALETANTLCNFDPPDLGRQVTPADADGPTDAGQVEAHCLENMAGSVAARGAGGTIRNAGEVFQRDHQRLGIDALERDVEDVLHRPLRIAIEGRMKRSQGGQGLLAEGFALLPTGCTLASAEFRGYTEPNDQSDGLSSRPQPSLLAAAEQ